MPNLIKIVPNRLTALTLYNCQLDVTHKELCHNTGLTKYVKIKKFLKYNLVTNKSLKIKTLYYAFYYRLGLGVYQNGVLIQVFKVVAILLSHPVE